MFWIVQKYKHYMNRIFIMNTITEWETILYVTLITICCWITNYKCNFFVKLSAFFILSVLCHIAFINVNLDLKYMYEDLVMEKNSKHFI